MKKTLLLCAVAMISIATFAQTSFADIPMSNTTSYPVPTSFTVANGASIYVPVSSFTASTGPYWDLSSYAGIEVSFTCDAADLNKKFVLRAAVVKSDVSGVVDALQTVTFTSTTQIVTYNFSEEPFLSNSKRVWGFKNPWSGNDAFTAAVTINHIKALSVINSAETLSSNSKINPNSLVDVYNIMGKLVRKNMKYSDLKNKLPNGIYIIGNKKICISNN